MHIIKCFIHICILHLILFLPLCWIIIETTKLPNSEVVWPSRFKADQTISGEKVYHHPWMEELRTGWSCISHQISSKGWVALASFCEYEILRAFGWPQMDCWTRWNLGLNVTQEILISLKCKATEAISSATSGGKISYCLPRQSLLFYFLEARLEITITQL